MNIYVYSDESGVFDKTHNDYFVFGGVICLGKQDKELWARRYSATERELRKSLNYVSSVEMKACIMSVKHKNSFYRSLNGCYKFGAIIEQQRVLDQIFRSKKDKQRYLDYAYKLAVKFALVHMMEIGVFEANEIENIYFYVDEHTTATNGKYELREALEQELKNGTYNIHYNHFYEPVFPHMGAVELKFCDSSTVTLVRAADMIANHFYYVATKKNCNFREDIENRNAFIKLFP